MKSIEQFWLKEEVLSHRIKDNDKADCRLQPGLINVGHYGVGFLSTVMGYAPPKPGVCQVFCVEKIERDFKGNIHLYINSAFNSCCTPGHRDFDGCYPQKIDHKIVEIPYNVVKLQSKDETWYTQYINISFATFVLAFIAAFFGIIAVL